MELRGDSCITRFFIGCHEQGEILHDAIRGGDEKITAAIKQISSPPLDDLYQDAIDECRADGVGNMVAERLLHLRETTRCILNVAVRIADYDPPATTLPLEWMEAYGKHLAEIEKCAPLCPAPEQLAGDERRAKFCFEQWQSGRTYKEINSELRRQDGWEGFEDEKAVRGPIHAWAKRIGATPRKGQPGRKQPLN